MNYGIPNIPQGQMMPNGPMMYPNPNMMSGSMIMDNNDLENRLSKLERQYKRLDQRLTRLETPYKSNTNLLEPDNSMYMM